MDRNAKINIIADIQKELNKRMKKWCEAESSFIEKRSFVHKDPDVFIDKQGKKFKVNKKYSTFTDIFDNYNLNEVFDHRIVEDWVSDLFTFVNRWYSKYAQSIQNQDELYASYQPIKFVFYGLHYIDENTIELQYGFADVIDNTTNIQYI